jgi:hypothetical protein
MDHARSAAAWKKKRQVKSVVVQRPKANESAKSMAMLRENLDRELRQAGAPPSPSFSVSAEPDLPINLHDNPFDPSTSLPTTSTSASSTISHSTTTQSSTQTVSTSFCDKSTQTDSTDSTEQTPSTSSPQLLDQIMPTLRSINSAINHLSEINVLTNQNLADLAGVLTNRCLSASCLPQPSQILPQVQQPEFQQPQPSCSKMQKSSSSDTDSD